MEPLKRPTTPITHLLVREKFPIWIVDQLFIYFTIYLGFNALVEKSSESAQLALSTVPQIEYQIRDAENRVAEAENVCIHRPFVARNY